MLHELKQRFGFRTIEVRPGEGLFVNGQRIMLRGVCHHVAWPTLGRSSSDRIDALDIDLIQDMNMNAARMSHYPPDEEFLDLCDEKGLYVLDELTGWQHKYDTDVGRQHVKEMISRDVNHPSILIWDNGNEGGWNTNLDADFTQLDPQHRAVDHPWTKFGDLNDTHYPDFNSLLKLLNGKSVYMTTEFLHGLYDGGLGAGLDDYWNAMRGSKVSAGGFLWVFADEGVQRGDSNNVIDVKGNWAPDGIVGPFRRKGSQLLYHQTNLVAGATARCAADKFQRNIAGGKSFRVHELVQMPFHLAIAEVWWVHRVRGDCRGNDGQSQGRTKKSRGIEIKSPAWMEKRRRARSHGE